MATSTKRIAALFALLGAFPLAGCGEKPKETASQKLQRALDDKAMADEQAIALMADACFRGLQEASTLPPADGKITAVLTVHGGDISQLPATVANTAPGGITAAIKKIQFITILKSLDRFLENGRKRNLGDVVFTLQSPTAAEGEVKEWVDAYRFKLLKKDIDSYLKTSDLDTDARLAAAERIWKVEFDHFKNFQYGGN